MHNNTFLLHEVKKFVKEFLSLVFRGEVVQLQSEVREME